MKRLVSLLSCLLLIGCGEKSSSEGSQSTGENPTPSNDSAEPSVDVEKPPPVESAVAESPSGEPSESPNSLSDADVERFLKEAVEAGSLEQRGRLVYQNSEPYSGWAKRMHDSGQPETLARLKDGKMDGLYVVWRKNGKKKYEENYKDGERHGLYVEWHENGQKKSKENYKDGKSDGPYTSWRENGQKEVEGTFKGDEQDGLWTKWHENGQKLGEETYKDAEPDGLWATWHKNGQKRSEGTYKDGKFVDGSDKYWNRKGEEVETREEAHK